MTRLRQLWLVKETSIAVGAAWGAHPSNVGPDLGLGPHHETLRVEQVIASRYPHRVFVDEVFDTDRTRRLRLPELPTVNIRPLRCKLVHSAESSLSRKVLRVKFSVRPTHLPPDFLAIVCDFEHLLLLKVFLLLDLNSAHSFADLNNCDDYPGHNK